MTEQILQLSAGLFWISLLVRFFKKPRLTAVYEKICFIIFTAGLVLYIQGGDPAAGRWPISWLLLTWCINAAQIINELFYDSRHTAWFASTWSAIALSLPASTQSKTLSRVFTRDMEWLNFHRLCFLLAYAFCILMIPLALRSLKKNSDLVEEEERMQYRMALWALPLLTVGFLIETLFLLEKGDLPGPVQIWTERREAFLALGTWFFCGIYLHMRITYAWKGAKTAGIFLLGVVLIFAGNFSEKFLQFHALP
jgi:hypothetical protein